MLAPAYRVVVKSCFNDSQFFSAAVQAGEREVISGDVDGPPFTGHFEALHLRVNGKSSVKVYFAIDGSYCQQHTWLLPMYLHHGQTLDGSHQSCSQLPPFWLEQHQHSFCATRKIADHT